MKIKQKNKLYVDKIRFALNKTSLSQKLRIINSV